MPTAEEFLTQFSDFEPAVTLSEVGSSAKKEYPKGGITAEKFLAKHDKAPKQISAGTAMSLAPIGTTGLSLKSLPKGVEKLSELADYIPHLAAPERIRQRPLEKGEGQAKQLGPVLGVMSQAAFAGAKGLTGLLGFFASIPDKILDPEVYGDAGGVGGVANETIGGTREMILNLPAQIDYMAGEITRAPIFANKTGPDKNNLLAQIFADQSGKSVEQWYNDAVNSLFESGGSDVIFALEMVKAPIKLAQKGGKIVEGIKEGRRAAEIIEQKRMVEQAQAEVAEMLKREGDLRAQRAIESLRGEGTELSKNKIVRPEGQIGASEALGIEGKLAQPSAGEVLSGTGKKGRPIPSRPKTEVGASEVLEPVVEPARVPLGESLSGTGKKVSDRKVRPKDQVGASEALESPKKAAKVPFSKSLGIEASKKVIVGAVAATGGTVAIYKALQAAGDEDASVIKAALSVGFLGAFTPKVKSFIRQAKPTMFMRTKYRIPNTEMGRRAVEAASEYHTNLKLNVAKDFALFENVSREIGSVMNRSTRQWLRKNFKKAIESPESVKVPNDLAQRFLDAYNVISDRIGIRAQSAGIVTKGGEKFRKLKNYVPHLLTEEVRVALEVQSGPIWHAMQKELKARGIEPNVYLRSVESGYNIKEFGPVDFRRIANFPDEITVNGKRIKIHETDPFKMIPHLIDGAWRRILVEEQFGGRATRVAEQIGVQLKKEGGIPAENAWRDIWQDMNGYRVSTFDRNNVYFKTFSALEHIARTAQLSLAAVSNIGGYYPIATRHGLRNSVRAFFDTFKPSKQAEIQHLRTLGGWSYDVMRDIYYTQDLTGISGAASKKILSATGLNVINRHINKVASLAAKYDLIHAMELMKEGKTNNFRRVTGDTPTQYKAKLQRFYDFSEADIARMVKEGISEIDMARVVQMAPEAVNLFKETGLVRPRWLSTEVGRRMFAYTGYVRAIGNVASDAVWEAKSGNVAPLAQLLIGGVVSGEAILAMKAWLLDRAREDNSAWERLWHNLTYAGTLGLLGEIGQRVEWTVKYAKYGDEKLIDVTPPTFDFINSLLVNTAKGVGATFDEDDDEALGEWLDTFGQRNIPLYRAIVRHYNKNTAGVSYIADRLENVIYTTEGYNSKGIYHFEGEPKPQFIPETTKMLMERLTPQEKKLVTGMIRQRRRRKRQNK